MGGKFEAFQLPIGNQRFLGEISITDSAGKTIKKIELLNRPSGKEFTYWKPIIITWPLDFQDKQLLHSEGLAFLYEKDIPKVDIRKTYDNLYKILPRILRFENELEYKLFLLWAFSTWKYECFDSTGYLGFYPANLDNDSNIGKTTAMKILEYLTYRGERAINTEAKFYKAVERCQRYLTTMLVDETQDSVKKNKNAGTDAYVYLKNAYDVKYIYRFMALGGLRYLPHDVQTRMITFYMKNHYVEDMENYIDDLDKARTELLLWKYFEPDVKKYNIRIANENRTDKIFFY